MIIGYMLYSLLTASVPLSIGTAGAPNPDGAPTEIIIYTTPSECQTHLRTDAAKPIDVCIPVYRLKTKDNTMVDNVKEKLCN